MITDSFDISKPIITPENFIKAKEHVCDTCIVTFSGKIFNHVLSTFKNTKLGSLHHIDTDSCVYVFETDNRKFGIYLSRTGAPAATLDLLAARQYTGATNYILFGSAGNLNPEMTKGKFVVPTQAYRDEGLSYHYAPPEDYIDIKNSNKVSDIMEELKVPSVSGRIWTTDAIYMETENLFNKRKADGCLAVDMEISAIQAVCNYYGLELFCFLETGDVLSTISYDKTGLAKANHQLDKLYVALEIAKKISC